MNKPLSSKPCLPHLLLYSFKSMFRRYFLLVVSIIATVYLFAGEKKCFSCKVSYITLYNYALSLKSSIVYIHVLSPTRLLAAVETSP